MARLSINPPISFIFTTCDFYIFEITTLYMLDETNELREAIKASPNNLPLRKLLLNSLMRQKKYEEAEIEARDALKIFPREMKLNLALVECFLHLKKTSVGLVIIEEITAKGTPPAQAFLLQAKLQLQASNPQEAQESYEKAIVLDPNLKDTFLESEINTEINKGTQPRPGRISVGNQQSSEMEAGNDSGIDIERPKVTFADVGGMEAVKEEINLKIISPLKFPDLYKAYGKEIGGGILLYGPPGCGKTFIARATAGEVNANFIYVGITDILDMWIGNSEKNLHAIFEKARRMKPCVLFFDEVDALAASRTDMRLSAAKNVINQFLAELDGQYSNDGVLVLGATNAPWHLDNAFRRGERFSRIIFVPPPNESSRETILRLQLKDKPANNIDFKKIASRTQSYSGADLKTLTDMAVEHKLEEAMRKGKLIPLETEDFLKAIKKHRATTIEWFSTAKNYALFSNEAGLYDEILAYLKIKK